MATLGHSLLLMEFLAKVSQLEWFTTLIILSPLQFVELEIEQIVAQDSSWMKIMSNSDLTSRMVLITKEFFWMFYENNLMSLKIIFFYHSRLNELILFEFLEVLRIL